MNKINLQAPHSKWKKLLNVLFFIGLTKVESAYKKISLVDCLLTPHCLVSTKTDL